MIDAMEKRIGKNIRVLRRKAGLTQEQLAAKLQVRGFDMTRSAIAKVEVGQRHLYANEIVALKEILDIPYDDIFLMR